jgi:putative ABC transport system permease protein
MMILNYVKIALRFLWTNKTYSVINIAGLSAAMTVSVLILIFVVHEYNYDRFHLNGKNIYRAEKQFSRDGRHSLYANPEFGPSLMQADARVVNYVRTYSRRREVVKSDLHHRFFEERFLFADTSFFSVFSFPLVKGDRRSLAKPSAIIITEKTAARYFGTLDPIGKVLTLDSKYLFEVTGVAKNPPSNSSVQFDFIASFSALMTMPAERDMVLNNSSGFPTWLLLAHPDDLPEVRKTILKINYTNAAVTYSLAPLFENHFNLNFGDTANTRYVLIFLCIAMVILALALVNYMNITTARATSRAREVGIRKVIGAARKSLSVQFYIESAVTTTISFLVALVLVQIFKPVFLNVLQQEVDTSFLMSPPFIGVVFALLMASIVLAGSYPALVLPHFKPVDVLNGKLISLGKGAWLRKLLTVFQFSASVALAICTIIMNHQLNYLQAKNTGLARERVMVVPLDQISNRQLPAFKNELRSKAGISSLGMASFPLYRSSLYGLSLVSSAVSAEKVGAKWIVTDDEFLSVLNITWAMKPETKKITGNHLLNEAAAEAMGMSAVDSKEDFTMGGDHVPAVTGKILGVVKDFNYETLRSRVQPMIISVVVDTIINTIDRPSLYIRLDSDARLTDKIASIQASYEKYAGEVPFSYYFLDDAFNDLQKGENRLSQLFGVFTGIALIIACLGLFGLVTFKAESKTKEISIRKVLGASVTHVVALLTEDILALLSISLLVGVPLALFAMKKWLSNFFYQTDISAAAIIVPSIALVLISVSVVWAKGLKVAFEDPTKNLKSE